MKLFLLTVTICIYIQSPTYARSDVHDQTDSTLKRYQADLDHAIKVNRKDSEALYLGYIGYDYQLKNNFTKAFELYEKGYAIAQQIDDTTMIANFLLNMGIMYKQQGDYTKALENLLYASTSFEKMYNRYQDNLSIEDLASCFNSIADIYRLKNDTNLARGYYLTGLELRKISKNKIGIAGSFNCLGKYFMEIQQYDSALYYLDQSLRLKEEIGDTSFIPSTYLSIGQVYAAQKDDSNAEKNFLKAINMKGATGDKIAYTEACSALATLYFNQRKYDLALQFIDKGNPFVIELGLKAIILDNFDLKRKIYRAQNKPQLALEYDNLYISLKDSILNEKRDKSFMEMSVKYESEKKDHQLETLILLQKEQQLRFIIMIVFMSLLSIIVIIVVIGLKREKRNKVRIEMLMKELNHRVKNNLQLLQSLLNMQQERLDDPKAKEAVMEIENRVKSMIYIHRNFYHHQDIATIDLKEYLSTIVKDLVHSYGYDLNTLSYSATLDNVSINIDRAILLGLLVNEIISNSFKHAFKGAALPELKISLRSINYKQFELELGDNSTAVLTNEHIEKADSFGLKLIRLLSKQLKAEMTIVNTNGVYYRFKIEQHPR